MDFVIGACAYKKWLSGFDHVKKNDYFEILYRDTESALCQISPHSICNWWQRLYNMCLKVNHVSGQMKKQNKTKIKQNKKHREKEINLQQMVLSAT